MSSKFYHANKYLSNLAVAVAPERLAGSSWVTCQYEQTKESQPVRGWKASASVSIRGTHCAKGQCNGSCQLRKARNEGATATTAITLKFVMPTHVPVCRRQHAHFRNQTTVEPLPYIQELLLDILYENGILAEWKSGLGYHLQAE